MYTNRLVGVMLKSETLACNPVIAVEDCAVEPVEPYKVIVQPVEAVETVANDPLLEVH